MARRSERPTVRWATAAATLFLLPPSAIVPARPAFERGVHSSETARDSTVNRTLGPMERPAVSGPLGLGAQVLFVAGSRKNVRFRVDLRNGTLATPSAPKLLEGIVEVVVAERLLFLCHQARIGSARTIVGFDLETGVQIRDAAPDARAASIDATFCTKARKRQTPAGWEATSQPTT